MIYIVYVSDCTFVIIEVFRDRLSGFNKRVPYEIVDVFVLYKH